MTRLFLIVMITLIKLLIVMDRHQYKSRSGYIWRSKPLTRGRARLQNAVKENVDIEQLRLRDEAFQTAIVLETACKISSTKTTRLTD